MTLQLGTQSSFDTWGIVLSQNEGKEKEQRGRPSKAKSDAISASDLAAPAAPAAETASDLAAPAAATLAKRAVGHSCF